MQKGGVEVLSKSNMKWVIIGLIIIGGIVGLVVPSIVRSYNIKSGVKALVSDIISKYDCINSFATRGKYQNIITLKANRKFNQMEYKQKIELIKEIYDMLDPELFNIQFDSMGTYDHVNLCTKYKLFNDKDWKDANELSRVEVLFSDRKYFIGKETYQSIYGINVEPKTQETGIITSESKSDSELVTEIIKRIQGPYIVDVNMPDSDPLMLHIAFNNDFFSLPASKQYQIIREQFIKYEKVITESGKNELKYILRVFLPDKKMIVYTMTNRYYQCFKGDWFDGISNISVFELDDNPKQIDKLLNTEMLEGDQPAAGNIWGYSSNKDENLKSPSNNNSSYSDDDDEYYVAVAAENEVKKRLKAPSTAKFPSISNYAISKEGDAYKVLGYVDAENSFGAKLRISFTAKIKRTGENTYIVLDVQIDE